MKKIKLLALLVVMAMSFGLIFTGCSSDKKSDDKDSKNESVNEDEAPIEDDEEDVEDIEEDVEDLSSDSDSIVGEWEGKIDMTDMMSEMMELSFGEYASDFELDEFAVDVEMEFTEDEMTISIPSGAFDDAAESLASAIEPVMEAALETEAEANDMTVDEYLEDMGMTEDEFMEMFSADTLIEGFEMSMEEMEETSEYTIEDDEIVDEDGVGMEYDLEDDELIIHFEEEGMEFDIVLERQ